MPRASVAILLLLAAATVGAEPLATFDVAVFMVSLAELGSPRRDP